MNKTYGFCYEQNLIGVLPNIRKLQEILFFYMFIINYVCIFQTILSFIFSAKHLKSDNHYNENNLTYSS